MSLLYISSNSVPGLYLIMKLEGAVLIGGQRVKEGGY